MPDGDTWTAKFWKTVAENVLIIDLTVFLATAGGTNAVGDVKWGVVGWGLVLATAGAVLKCLLGKRVGDKQTANFIS